MSTPNDNQEKRVKRGTWRNMRKGVDSEGQQWEFRRYDGPTCCVIRKVAAAQPSPAVVEQALAQEKANQEKINATVQAARASATRGDRQLAQTPADYLLRISVLQAQRDELLADIKAASAILSQPVQFSDTAKLGTMDSATLAERAVYILRSDCGTAREMLKAAIARATEGPANQ